MATTFQFEHEFPEISMELFEKYLNHPVLNKKLSSMPGFKSRDMLEEQKLPGGETLWKFKVVAGGDVPASMQKLLPDNLLTWMETSRFVPNDHAIHWQIEPLIAKGKFEGKGSWALSKKGKGTKRVIDGEISVKIPFVGKVIESFIVEQLRRSYEVEPGIQNGFYREMKKTE